MIEFGSLVNVNLRDIWPNEALDFTPWLAKNINTLGAALGMELEMEAQEASVGDFSLDILAKDLGTGRRVIIENQLTQTDHDHLGKLLTYASGFDATTVVWIAGVIRDEHRQAIEWLNQRTDTETQFFCIVIEVLKVNDSKPAYNFKIIVSPNEWQKTKRGKTIGQVSAKGEAYRGFFQSLIDDLREKHKFTGARIGQPQNYYEFSSGITTGVRFVASFNQGGRLRVEVYIDQGDAEKNNLLFDVLENQRDVMEKNFGTELEWCRLDDIRACRIAISRTGHIELPDDELHEIHKWMIQHLLAIKEVFTPAIKSALKSIA